MSEKPSDLGLHRTGRTAETDAMSARPEATATSRELSHTEWVFLQSFSSSLFNIIYAVDVGDAEIHTLVNKVARDNTQIGQ